MTKVLTVYDSKAEAYLTPMFAPTTNYAIRMFRDAANTDSHDFSKFPGDFTLFEIGEWDENAGEMLLFQTMQNLGTALSHKKEITNGNG